MNTNAVSKRSNDKATQRVRPRKKRGQAAGSGTKAEQIAVLEARAFHWVNRGREANLELGRTFIELKKIVGHGRWQDYYRERFGTCGVALRTAEEYMKAAREAEAAAKNADSAIFPVAKDGTAQKMRAATERAQAEVGKTASGKSMRAQMRLDDPGPYELPPIHLTREEKVACDELVKLYWAHAEGEIVSLLKRLCVEGGITQ